MKRVKHILGLGELVAICSSFVLHDMEVLSINPYLPDASIRLDIFLPDASIILACFMFLMVVLRRWFRC